MITDADDKWENGLESEGEGCGSARAWDDCGNDDKLISDVREGFSFTPYVVYTTDHCSTWGYGRTDEKEYRTTRLLRNLAASESFVIEQELWSDSLGLGNPKIADTANVTISTAIPILNAVAAIDDAAGDLARGGQVFIHMRPYQFTLLVAEQVLEKVGNKWYTPMGSIVVPGRGYAGTGPAGQAPTASEEWVYGTAAVEVRLGKTLTIDNPQDVVERSTNDVVLLTERKAVASFDPNCLRIAVKVSR